MRPTHQRAQTPRLQDQRPEFIKQQEQGWKAWQAQKKRDRSARKSGVGLQDIEEAFTRAGSPQSARMCSPALFHALARTRAPGHRTTSSLLGSMHQLESGVNIIYVHVPANIPLMSLLVLLCTYCPPYPLPVRPPPLSLPSPPTLSFCANNFALPPPSFPIPPPRCTPPRPRLYAVPPSIPACRHSGVGGGGGRRMALGMGKAGGAERP